MFKHYGLLAATHPEFFQNYEFTRIGGDGVITSRSKPHPGPPKKRAHYAPRKHAKPARKKLAGSALADDATVAPMSIAQSTTKRKHDDISVDEDAANSLAEPAAKRPNKKTRSNHICPFPDCKGQTKFATQT